MKVQSILTLIVAKNYGRPHTWSLPAWKVYLGGVALGVVLALLLGLSLVCLIVWPRWRSTEESLRRLRQERDALREQVLSLNQEALDAKERQLYAQAESDDARQDNGDGMTAPNTPSYEQPIRITSLTAKIVHSNLEIGFQMESQDRGRGNRGGLLFTVFENQDVKPPTYMAGPGVQLNESGFPESYKEGAYFPRVIDHLALRRRFRLDSPTEYFTHITVYLFSPRGGLIAKERFPLDRSVFAELHFQARSASPDAVSPTQRPS